MPSWGRPRSHPHLGDGDVHVWAARLDRPHPCSDELARTLSDGERRRLDRLAFPADRRRFVARRGVLRTILARYVGCDARRLQLRSAARGKPELVRDPGATPIEFSCSSSGELALYAVAHDLRIGIDVERVRAVLEPLELARSALSERECAMLAALPADGRHETFLQRWTLKEAYLKGRGDGLAAVGEPDTADPGWSLRPLALGGTYVGAVAAEAREWRLRCWRW